MKSKSEKQDTHGDKAQDPALPFKRAIRVRTINDARRLLSRLIYLLQVEKIEARHAKDLCYLCNCFVNITRDSDIESRLEILETEVEKNRNSQ